MRKSERIKQSNQIEHVTFFIRVYLFFFFSQSLVLSLFTNTVSLLFGNSRREKKYRIISLLLILFIIEVGTFAKTNIN